MGFEANPVVAGKIGFDKCDFQCGKTGELLIAFHNTDNGHTWVCHLSCLNEQLGIQEDLLLAEAGIEEYAEGLRKIDEG